MLTGSWFNSILQMMLQNRLRSDEMIKHENGNFPLPNLRDMFEKQEQCYAAQKRVREKNAALQETYRVPQVALGSE